MNRVGGVEITHVNAVTVSRELVNEGLADEHEREVVTFHRCQCGPPVPVMKMGRMHVVANGVDFGIRDLCCQGGGWKDAGHFSVKWRI